MKFRKKPVVIEAVQFTGSNLFECLRFMRTPEHIVNNLELKATDAPIIHTLEGEMRTSPGDWIIRGVKGEYYPCKPDIFAATYEAVGQHFEQRIANRARDRKMHGDACSNVRVSPFDFHEMAKRLMAKIEVAGKGPNNEHEEFMTFTFDGVGRVIVTSSPIVGRGEIAFDDKLTFEEGDVVRVKAGPPMTIQNVCALIEGKGIGVLCTWFDENHEIRRMVFDPLVLEHTTERWKPTPNANGMPPGEGNPATAGGDGGRT